MYAVGKRIVKVKSLAQPYCLWALGDIHHGNRGCHESLLDATIARIAADPHSLWIGMGDYADLISMADKRFDPEAVAEKVRGAYFQKLGPTIRDQLIQKLLPIADKCVGLLRGNHEFSYEQRYEQAIVSDVCEALNKAVGAGQPKIPYMGYSGFLDLVFRCRDREESFRICAHHGAGYAATKGGKLNRLLQFMRQFDGDLFVMGHVHENTETVMVVVGANEACDDLVQYTKVGVITGTFLKTYALGPSGYGERKMYSPVPLGAPSIQIIPEGRRLAVEKPWGLREGDVETEE